jgi:selenocysteine-specific elongation factor
MKSIIVGTAGHIDHGKTALVKALTGIDADRLEEEKRRGITIDLGFAHMDLQALGEETLRLGFVDVPGHEKFVRNMLAGIGGIDLVLLVIAADEGVKPQTREHFDILQLLGVKRGITVLTKSDAVDRETLEVALLEAEEFLRGTFLDRPNPIVAVSSLTGAGLEELKRMLAAAAAQVPVRDSKAIPRLPIDRVFTMRGFGTVVTGTLVAGTVHREDELEILPTRKIVRVRGVQVHGSLVEQALAGQRTALNLAGASIEDLSRGMTLVPSGTFETTRLVDAKLRLLTSAPRALKNRARVHFHAYTMETVAEILLDGKAKSDENEKNLNTAPLQLRPGEDRFVRLRLPEPSLLLPQDRFIIRQFSPVMTIGGGVVLDANPAPRMPGRSDFLRVLDAGDSGEILTARIARKLAQGITIPELVAETGWARSVIETHLVEASLREHIFTIGERLVYRPAIYGLQFLILSTVEAFHKNNPLVGGIGKEQLREQASARADVFDAAITALVSSKKLEQLGELVRLPGHGVAMRDEETESKKKIEDAFASAGLQVPALDEVLSGLKIDRARAQKIVTLLLRDKVLVKVSDELVFHRDALYDLRQKLAAYKAKSAKIDVAGFKELTSVTRKYAIPLLEYFDRERVTKRVGDARQIL